MRLGETLYITDRKKWRAWLAKHHQNKSEIWLIYYRKETGKPRIEYNEAVEEALCYGWIDSIIKSIDKEKFAQRFSPRKKGSNLSQPNIERVKKLIKQKKMTKVGLAAIAHVFDPNQTQKLIVPAYILKALKANEKTWRNFQKLPEEYKRIRIAYIESQKKHDKGQLQRALRNFVNKTAQNKRIGIYKG